MGVFNELGKALQVETRRLDHVAVVDGIPHKACKAVPQEIQIARGPLDVGERGRPATFEEIKPRAAHDHLLGISEELLVMLLADRIEVHDFASAAIQYLSSG